MAGKIVAIFIAKQASTQIESVSEANLVAGRGIEGDRYFHGQGTFSKKLKGLPDRELTLVEAEEIDAFNKKHSAGFKHGDFRRNILTSGIRLNDLVGVQFWVGGALVEGVRLCEPCKHLGAYLAPIVATEMAGRTGLRARIVSSGTVKVGEEVVRPAV